MDMTLNVCLTILLFSPECKEKYFRRLKHDKNKNLSFILFVRSSCQISGKIREKCDIGDS